MKEYEMLFVIPNKYTDLEIPDIIKQVEDLITSKEGKISETKNLGKRKLAYTVKGYNHGCYVLISFEAPGEALKQINTPLLMMPEVLRHLITNKIDTGISPERAQEVAENIIRQREEYKRSKEAEGYHKTPFHRNTKKVDSTYKTNTTTTTTKKPATETKKSETTVKTETEKPVIKKETKIEEVEKKKEAVSKTKTVEKKIEEKKEIVSKTKKVEKESTKISLENLDEKLANLDNLDDILNDI